MNKDLDLLTIEEMMDKFKVVRATIYNWMKRGMPSIKIGKTLRFDKQEVIKWVQDQQNQNK